MKRIAVLAALSLFIVGAALISWWPRWPTPAERVDWQAPPRWALSTEMDGARRACIAEGSYFPHTLCLRRAPGGAMSLSTVIDLNVPGGATAPCSANAAFPVFVSLDGARFDGEIECRSVACERNVCTGRGLGLPDTVDYDLRIESDNDLLAERIVRARTVEVVFDAGGRANSRSFNLPELDFRLLGLETPVDVAWRRVAEDAAARARRSKALAYETMPWARAAPNPAAQLETARPVLERQYPAEDPGRPSWTYAARRHTGVGSASVEACVASRNTYPAQGFPEPAKFCADAQTWHGGAPAFRTSVTVEGARWTEEGPYGERAPDDVRIAFGGKLARTFGATLIKDRPDKQHAGLWSSLAFLESECVLAESLTSKRVFVEVPVRAEAPLVFVFDTTGLETARFPRAPERNCGA